MSKSTTEEMLKQLEGWRNYCMKGEEGERGCRETCGMVHAEECLQRYNAIRALILAVEEWVVKAKDIYPVEITLKDYPEYRLIQEIRDFGEEK